MVKSDSDNSEWAENRLAERQDQLRRKYEKSEREFFGCLRAAGNTGSLSASMVESFLKDHLPLDEEIEEWTRWMELKRDNRQFIEYGGESELRKARVIKNLREKVRQNKAEELAKDILDQYRIADYLLGRSKLGNERDWRPYEIKGIIIFLSPLGRTSHLSNSLYEMLNFFSPVVAMSEPKFQGYDPTKMKYRVSDLLGLDHYYPEIDKLVDPTISINERLALLERLMVDGAKAHYGADLEAMRVELDHS